MSKYPSARELVNKALGKKLSPKGQAVLDAIRAGFPADPPELLGTDTFAGSNNSPTGPNTIPPRSALPANHRSDHSEPAPSSNVIHSAPNPPNAQRKAKLLQLIETKLAEAKAAKSKRTKPAPATRAQINRANGKNSTGPKSPEGKAASSSNSLKHGFFANVQKLNPHDSDLYQETYHDLRMGLQPDGPVERTPHPRTRHLQRPPSTPGSRRVRVPPRQHRSRPPSAHRRVRCARSRNRHP